MSDTLKEIMEEFDKLKFNVNDLSTDGKFKIQAGLLQELIDLATPSIKKEIKQFLLKAIQKEKETMAREMIGDENLIITRSAYSDILKEVERIIEKGENFMSEEKLKCPRCCKTPRFMFHICKPTFDWIDRQIENEVKREIKKHNINLE